MKQRENRPERKAQPLRTCLGCNRQLPKKQLLKFVLHDGIMLHDCKGTGRGRSAYCCKKKNCTDVFLGQKKKLSRAFRAQVDKIRFELKDWE